MANQWLRLYSETLNDPKIQTLPLESFRAWINALCLACQLDNPDGNIGTIDDVSFAFRETKSSVSSAFHTLIERGLIETVNETFHIPKWKKRQYKSDTSTDRVKRFRKRFRNVTETPPEQSRTDTEQNRAEAPPLPPEPKTEQQPTPMPSAAACEEIKIIQAFDAALTTAWGASRARIAPQANDRMTALRWLESKIPVTFCQDYFHQEMSKMHSKNRPPPRSLSFFDEGLKTSFASGKSVPIATPKPDEKDLWSARVNDFLHKNFWLQNWGDPPTSPSCLCPPEILAEYGVAA